MFFIGKLSRVDCIVWLWFCSLGVVPVVSRDEVANNTEHSGNLMRHEAGEGARVGSHIARHESLGVLHDGLAHVHAHGAAFNNVIVTAHNGTNPTFDARAPSSLDRRAWLAVLFVPLLLSAGLSEKTGPSVIVACYILSSLSMTVLNKLAVSTFRSTYLLVVVQMVVAIVIIVCVEYDRIKYGEFQDFLKWMIVPCAFAGMLTTSMLSLSAASISAVLITRNLLPVISFAAEKFLFGDPPTVIPSMVTSLLVAFTGTLLYAQSDSSLSGSGKFYIVLNCFITLVDRLAQTYYLKKSPDFSLSIPLCMVLNNAVGALLICAFATYTGDIMTWSSILREIDSTTAFWVVMSSSCGACLGYVGLRTQKLVSGTSILVLQNFNKMFLLILGYVVFSDRLRPLAWAGCVVSMGGCCWYSATRLPTEIQKK